jgi:hypothetical protein
MHFSFFPPYFFILLVRFNTYICTHTLLCIYSYILGLGFNFYFELYVDFTRLHSILMCDSIYSHTHTQRESKIIIIIVYFSLEACNSLSLSLILFFLSLSRSRSHSHSLSLFYWYVCMHSIIIIPYLSRKNIWKIKSEQKKRK